MSEPTPLFPRQLSKHERFDHPEKELFLAPLSADPIEAIVKGPRHARNSQIGLRVDENEQRIVTTIREQYERKFGEQKSDQDVIRGIIRFVGRMLIDSGKLDEAENIEALRSLARLLRARSQALEERRQYDAELATIEGVTREVAGFVSEKLFAKAYRSAKDFLDRVAETVSKDPEGASWMLAKIAGQDGFVDAVEKLQAQGYDISLPVVD